LDVRGREVIVSSLLVCRFEVYPAVIRGREWWIMGIGLARAGASGIGPIHGRSVVDVRENARLERYGSSPANRQTIHPVRDVT
jgi:hypothetical protein